ncbi:AAA family ATPase [Serratia marcescens]|uniref:AAA family ATPase n=1 Tax=Serratia marcescens TaxID=615 RepID=UPI001867E97D|nr:AAA family ATPase [Serratia marcescens]
MTPIEQIKNWIQDKPIWWKHSIKLALAHGELDQRDFDEIYNIARTEHQLEDFIENTFPNSQDLDFSGHISEQGKVNLVSLSEVYGVGALIENQIIKFGKNGVFIVYGDNGAGKSSYASIMKNACLTRGPHPEILGNVFEKNNPNPKAKISISVNDKEETYSWSLNSPNTPLLKSIRVFDTNSAHHYVNKEDSLGFKPSGLNLLTELTRAINQVKAIVEEDIMPGNGLVHLKPIDSETKTARFFNTISANTKEDDLNNHRASTEELERIEPLRQEIVKHRLHTPESLKAELNHKKQIILPLQKKIINSLKSLDNKSFEKFKELQEDYIKKQESSENIMRATLQGLPLDTVAGINWQVLWNAAKEFIENEPKSQNFPPSQGEYCPLCLQEISKDSSERLASLNKYLADNAAQEAKNAYDLLKDLFKIISSQNTSLEDYKAAIEELNKLKPGISDRITVMLETLAKRQDGFTIISKLSNFHSTNLDTSALSDINTIIQNLTDQIETIKTNNDLVDVIKKKENDLQEILDKKYINENYESIIRNIRRYKVIKKMEGIKIECNTRRISDLSSRIYQQSVIEPLTSAFSNELKQFGFTRFSVDVQTRNSNGQQQFKLSIANAGEPIVAKVASEGEQRCIAIAAFLAEMKADNRQSAVIFDDPVNSLSHQWSSKVAARLIAESHCRQVIIFTHDIVFFKLLLEQVELQGAKYESIALERSRKFAGLVRDSAPWEALTTSKRIRHLNAELHDLRKLDKEGTENDFRQTSRTFYGLLRETWERLVEEKLLNKVVNRFERGIYTQRLSRLIDISATDIEKVDHAMGKCSTYFTGHDSAPAIGNAYPTLEEIEADLKNIKDFLDELQNTRKRA